MTVHASPSVPSATDGQGAGTSASRLRGRGRARLSALGTRINAMSYLPKWLILASTIGVIAGCGAIVFYEALKLSTEFFLGFIAGYHPPSPAGEGLAAGSSHYAHWWLIPIVVTIGGLLAGFIVFTWAPEAEGHGTDAAIDAVHHNPRAIRVRAIVVKIVASAITIGSGGSGGREGPTAQISAGFGSLLARVLDLSPEDGRIAVSVGIGSGIGAIFSAPLGGAVLAADIVYREDFEFQALLPGTFASIIAYAIFGAVYGYRPLFAIAGHYDFHQPIQLLWFAIIGLLAGGIGLFYSKAFYGVVELTKKIPFSRKLRPAVGALLVGFIALGLPEVIGTGYGWVQKGLSNDLASLPLYVILLLPFARIIATAFSIGTGGSGGVFGPGMVIGAFTGLAVWRLLEPIAPGVGHNPAPFVVVGMMAVFGGIARAPLAVMLMVAQMTGSISILAPAMVAVAISWFIVGRVDDSIYRSQLRNRSESAAGRFHFGLPLLASQTVADVAKAPRVVIAAAAPAEEALAEMQRAGVKGAPVVDEHGTFLGAVQQERLESLLAERPSALAGAVVDAAAATVAASASLDVGLEALMQTEGTWVAVTEGDRRVAGVLSATDVVAGYRRALMEDARRMERISSHAMAMDVRVGRHSRLAGRPIREAGLPHGCLVVTLHHQDSLVFATGSDVPVEGDVLSVLTQPDQAEAVRRLISGEGSDPEPTARPNEELRAPSP